MTKPDSKQEVTKENVSELFRKIDLKGAELLKEYVDEQIQARFEAGQRAMKIREESLFSSIETVLSALKMVEKTINYKLGAIESKKTKAEVVEVTSLDDALAMANKIRESRGLPPLVMPEAEQHELKDK